MKLTPEQLQRELDELRKRPSSYEFTPEEDAAIIMAREPGETDARVTWADLAERWFDWFGSVKAADTLRRRYVFLKRAGMRGDDND